jgi:hypothetical protein
MPQRVAGILAGQYQPWHVTNAATAAPVGGCVETTSATTISVGSNVVTPTTAQPQIVKGMRLLIIGGVGTLEIVQPTFVASDGSTFTAVFANTHSGAYHIISLCGTFVGPLIVNKVGTGETLTFYNGSPNATAYNANIGKVVAVITPNANKDNAFQAAFDYGLFYTLAGTPGDYTIQYIDMVKDVV